MVGACVIGVQDLERCTLAESLREHVFFFERMER